MRKLLALFIFCLPVVASDPYFPPSLKEHLGLTDDQISEINRLNRQFWDFQSEKFQRENQVNAELAEERAKEILDPLALGLRHLELEAIRREIEAERKKTVAKIQELLNPTQKERLAALDAALQMYPTALNAVTRNLLPGPAPQCLPASRVVAPGFPCAIPGLPVPWPLAP